MLELLANSSANCSQIGVNFLQCPHPAEVIHDRLDQQHANMEECETRQRTRSVDLQEDILAFVQNELVEVLADNNLDGL
jgi:hypothetical protein